MTATGTSTLIVANHEWSDSHANVSRLCSSVGWHRNESLCTKSKEKTQRALKILRFFRHFSTTRTYLGDNRECERGPIVSAGVNPTGTFWSRLATFHVYDQITIATRWQTSICPSCELPLRPDVVLFSRSSKTIVLLEQTVPLENNDHLAHDRQTTKYSALVTACEENGFKTHMFALEVGCISYCPHSFLHCFEALGLPKSAARQIRSEASKTALRSLYVLFSQRHADLGVSSCSLLNHAHVAIVSYLFIFFVFICFAISALHLSHPRQLVQFPSIHTIPPRFSNSPTVRRKPYSMRTPVFRALPSGTNHRAASRLRSTIRVRVVDWWISVSNLPLAALTF